MSTQEFLGRHVITRVSPDGPADKAGLQRGDLLIGVGAAKVGSQAEPYRRVWSLGAAGVEVPLRVRRGGEVREVVVKSIDRTAYFRDGRM